MASRVSSRLPDYLAVVYALLVLYGSLYPLVGWRDSGGDPFAFLGAGWPRYFTTFDLTANVLAYLPLGFFWATVLAARLPPISALLFATLAGGLLSFGVEFVQNFLPTRVPSNLDLLGNVIGASLGGLAGLRWGRSLLDGGLLHRWRERHFLAGVTGDRGLLLLGLWLLTQLNPETFLFGNGNLRVLFGLPPLLAFEAGHFIELEMAAVAAYTLVLALIVSVLARSRPALFASLFAAAALGAKSCALLLLMEGSHGLTWLTPGALSGLSLGVVLALSASQCAAAQRRVLAALALMLATVLTNLLPDNPYVDQTLRLWHQGHFLNFNGLTRLLSSLWPFLALSWLMLFRSER